MTYQQEFIEFMVGSGVLCFGEFTTKSGRQTPYFINAGNYCMASQAQKLGTYYADCLHAHFGDGYDVLFGPAYKGIPLAVTASVAMVQKYGVDKPYTFNRKEEKDHGEGGSFIGHKLKDGDRVIIIDDVVTAGTALKESMAILKRAADIRIEALVVSVDRMERAGGDRTALDDLRDELGIQIVPIVTLDDIVETLYNREVGGKRYIDDAMMEKINTYRRQYGPRI